MNFITYFVTYLADESIVNVFEAFGDGIGAGVTQMAQGVKDALENLIYDGEAGSRVISEPFKFIMMLAGFGIGLSLIFGLLNLVKVEV